MFVYQSKNILFLDICILLIAVSVFYALGLGSYPLFIPDEGRYVEVAREMVASGDYITPRLNGVGFFDKPILYYWLQASAIKLFGLNEWVFRLWPMLIGIWGCVCTYLTCYLLFERRIAILACSLLALNPLYYGATHYANLDLEVAVFISSALMFFLLGIETSSKFRGYFLLAGYLFAALAFLTKGLIGMVFPILIGSGWILLLKRFHLILKMRMFLGIVIFIGITLPWYYWVQKINPQFFNFFFITQQFSRFITAGEYNNKTDFWFYLPLLFAGFIPWSFFLFQSFFHSFKNIWKNKQRHARELFFILWFFCIFIFFSIPKSKTIGYILPTLPAAAIIVAIYFNQFTNRKAQQGIYAGLCGYILVCILTFIFCYIAPTIKNLNIQLVLAPSLHLTAGLFLCSGILAFIFLRKKIPFLYHLLNLAITIGIFLLIIVHNAQTLNYKSIKPIAMTIQQSIQPEDEVVTFYRYYQDLPVYLQKRITIVADWHAKDIVDYDNWQRELWYNMAYQNTSDWLIEEPVFWQRFQSNKKLFIILPEKFYPTFLQKMRSNTQHTRVYTLMIHTTGEDKVILLSNQPQ